MNTLLRRTSCDTDRIRAGNGQDVAAFQRGALYAVPRWRVASASVGEGRHEFVLEWQACFAGWCVFWVGRSSGNRALCAWSSSSLQHAALTALP